HLDQVPGGNGGTKHSLAPAPALRAPERDTEPGRDPGATGRNERREAASEARGRPRSEEEGPPGQGGEGDLRLVEPTPTLRFGPLRQRQVGERLDGPCRT